MKYECTSCESTDCKLWRDSKSYYRPMELFCRECLVKKGYRMTEYHLHGTMAVYDNRISEDQFIPAIPSLEGFCWDKGKEPKWWSAWWRALPHSRPELKPVFTYYKPKRSKL